MSRIFFIDVNVCIAFALLEETPTFRNLGKRFKFSMVCFRRFSLDSDTAVFLRLVRFLYRKVSGPAHVSYISLFVAKKNVKTKTNKKGKKHRVPFSTVCA